jgi:hypothetical protein
MQTKGSIGHCSLKSSQLPSLADRWRSVISLLIVLVLSAQCNGARARNRIEAAMTDYLFDHDRLDVRLPQGKQKFGEESSTNPVSDSPRSLVAITTD